jgi:hypothetical protein
MKMMTAMKKQRKAGSKTIEMLMYTPVAMVDATTDTAASEVVALAQTWKSISRTISIGFHPTQRLPKTMMMLLIVMQLLMWMQVLISLLGARIEPRGPTPPHSSPDHACQCIAAAANRQHQHAT